jgi:hypothetical protein
MDQADEIIAREHLFGVRPGEAKFPITIEIGRPFKWSGTCATEWACMAKIEPFRTHTVHGLGSFQALCLAFQWIRSQLNDFEKDGGSLVWEDGQEWDIESYWPHNPY